MINDLTKAIHFERLTFTPNFPDDSSASNVKRLWVETPLLEAALVKVMSCWGNRREGDHWGNLGVDGWIILGWISRRWDVGIWTGLGWPRIETGGGRS